jgi:MFS family permease
MEISSKEQRSVILAVTIGNILEWYEIYLYVYWAPVISKLFFNFESDFINLVDTFLLFGIGFLVRPLGGLFFGRLGDRIGRKKSLVLSVVTMTVPTFAIGLLPTYSQIGFSAFLILGILRILQSFPSGGELPGAFCFLYESANPQDRKYMASWGAVGNQIGIIISVIECYLLERYLSPEDLMNWGWRFSFILGGVIGLSGFYLRYKLHETPFFKQISLHHKINVEPVSKVLYQYRKGIIKGMFFCALDAGAFYLLSVFFPHYFDKILGFDSSYNLIVSIGILLLATLPIPFFGLLADKVGAKILLLISTISIIVLLYPLYISIVNAHMYLLYFTGFAFIMSLNCLTALIPYILCELFPTPVRFTCVGFSFNLVDGMIGGFTPIIVLYLLRFTGNEASFCWFILVCAIISLLSYLTINENKHTDVV